MPDVFHRSSATQASDFRRLSLVLALALGVAAVQPNGARADREACIVAHEDAQLARLRGRYTAARESLLRCAQSACPALISNDCITWLAEVDASLPSVVFEVSDAAGNDLVDVRVSANGQLLTDHLDGRALPLDPGVYTLRFESPGQAPTEQVVTMREAQKQRLVHVQLAPARRSESSASTRGAPRRWGVPLETYLVGGGAVSSLAAGITLGALGKQELDRLDAKCKTEEGCTADEKEHGKRLYIGADVAFGASVALAATATWLFFRARKRQSEQPARGNLSAGARRGGAWLGWRSVF